MKTRNRRRKRKNIRRKKTKYKKDKTFKRGRGFWGDLNTGLKKAYGYY